MFDVPNYILNHVRNYFLSRENSLYVFLSVSWSFQLSHKNLWTKHHQSHEGSGSAHDKVRTERGE